MWGLAAWMDRATRAKWQRDFGAPFTGLYEGRRVQLQWREVVVGHVCRGADPYNHLECIRMVSMQWRWVKLSVKQ
jgi:hypothetical protein